MLKGTPNSKAQARGFTLIELMVAMLLGLIVIGGVCSVFLANLNSYDTNQALSEVQSGSRAAFELMARDIRDAGLIGCNNGEPIANVVQGSNWWSNWSNAVVGYDRTQTDPAIVSGMPARAANTDSLMLLGSADTGLSVAPATGSTSANAANFKLNEPTSTLQTGDIIMVCDPNHATIVQITNYNSSNVTVVHDVGNSVSPGNCSKGLGYPTVCTTNGNQYSFGQNSQIAALNAVDWYVGTNPSSIGGTSLYRISVSPSATSTTPTGTAYEMVRNVTGMTLAYHQPPATGFVSAANVTNWSVVDAVQMTLKLQSSNQRAGTNSKPITRTFVATTTIRNRVQ
jgi:type IV pilus assembly protein PilW